MRKVNKFIVITILLAFVIPVFTASASSAQGANNEMDKEDYNFLSMEIFNLDGEQIFLDAGFSGKSVNTRSIPTEVISNGFLYHFTAYVKTKGQENVLAYTTEEELDDEEFQDCLTYIRQYFPAVR